MSGTPETPQPEGASPRRAPEAFDARIVSARALSPSVREIVFERADDRTLDFVPGQWVNLLVPHHGAEVKRAYSIASAPDGGRRFEIAVTRVEGGHASIELHEAPIGATFRAIGPSGLFTRDAADPASAVFVGTGTGVTPLRSMVRAALAHGSSARLVLLFGFRHEEDILYRAELEELARTHANLEITFTLSKPGPSWTGRTGYVQTHLPAVWSALGDPAGHVYVCGLERMVKTVRDMARNDLGVPRKQVHQERYD